MSLDDFAISIAVSCLSPVRTQTQIFDSISFSIVSGTPSYSLSSIALAPKNSK